jgi:hypothetical protein
MHNGDTVNEDHKHGRFTALRIALPPKFKRLSRLLLTVLIAAVLVTTRSSLPAALTVTSDPFAPYQAILPGQPSEVLADFHCDPINGRTNGQAVTWDSFCAVYPQQGTFDIINVHSRNSQITEVVFYATKLQLADFLLGHGYPVAQQRGERSLRLTWQYPTYSIKISTAHWRFENQIRVVTFTLHQ